MNKIRTTTFLIIIILILSIFVSGCNMTASFKEESPNSNNTLVWNLSYADIDSWDPHMSNSGVVADIGRQIFEGLTVLGEDGCQLGAAESFTVSANGEGTENTVYTFKLRQDAKWSDGKDVTAYDFEYGFKRACEKKSDASDIYGQYIKGADKYINGTGSLEDIKVKALDKYTLEIELNEPTPYFMEVLTNHQFYPAREDIVETAGEGWEINPKTCISNGPYKLHSYEPDSYILLSKNENYYDSKNIKTPYIKCLINTRNKNMDLMYDNNEVHIMRINPYGNLDGEDLLYSDYIGTSYIIFNTNRKPFDDVNVRKAFSYGIDSEYYSEEIYPDSIQASGFMPSDMKHRDRTTVGSKRENVDYLMNANSERAKQLLNMSGSDYNFSEVELTTDSEFFGDYIKNMLETNLNIKINLNIVQYEELVKNERTGNFEMITKFWIADYNDPMAFLSVFNANKSGNAWCNENFEEAVINSTKATGAQRDELLFEAEKILIDELPAIPVYHYRNCYRFNNNIVENLRCDAMGNLILKYCTLNPDNLYQDKQTGIDSYELNSIYGFDSSNRIEEIDRNGYFEDGAGYRFDKYINSKHFELYYSSENESNESCAENSIKMLEKEYDRILKFLNVDEKNMPVIKINMYDNYEALRQNLINETNYDLNDLSFDLRGIALTHNSVYCTRKNKYGAIIDLETTLLHEFTHTVTMALAPEQKNPDWLWDGIAMYMAQDEDRSEPYYEEMLNGGIPEIYTLKNNDRDRYKYGYSLVEYIVEEYGREKLVELLKEYGDIEKVLNITESEFRDGWIEFLKEKLHKQR